MRLRFNVDGIRASSRVVDILTGLQDMPIEAAVNELIDLEYADVLHWLFVTMPELKYETWIPWIRCVDLRPSLYALIPQDKLTADIKTVVAARDPYMLLTEIKEAQSPLRAVVLSKHPEMLNCLDNLTEAEISAVAEASPETLEGRDNLSSEIVALATESFIRKQEKLRKCIDKWRRK